MPSTDSFAEFIREQLAPLGGVALRRMFGTMGVFCDGLLIGLIRDDALHLRVDDGNRAAYEAEGAPQPLRYRRQCRPMELPFWRVPERLADEPDALLAWARAALAAARRVAAMRRPRR